MNHTLFYQQSYFNVQNSATGALIVIGVTAISIISSRGSPPEQWDILKRTISRLAILSERVYL